MRFSLLVWLVFSVLRYFLRVFLMVCVCCQTHSALAKEVVYRALLVDKKTNLLYLTQYEPQGYKKIFTYHVTLGQVKGDKEDENDLKTPEGIYLFSSLLLPPRLPAKFGAMAFSMNFPNPFDRLAGRTGNGIMLHATNEPERLTRNYDSQGCIVMENQDIVHLSQFVQLNLTPILIFAELTADDWRSSQDVVLTRFFQTWVKSWETQEIDQYIDHYHTDFTSSGKNKKQWKAYKDRLNHLYVQIKVQPENILYYRHPKYSMITFTQRYQSKLKNGKVGYHSQGTKILYVAEELGQPKIISETYANRIF